MKVYIAAPFPRKEEARTLRDQLKTLGVTVTSRWIDTHLDDSLPPDAKLVEANEDLSDIVAAHRLIVMTDHIADSSGGLFFEAGFAHGWDMPVITVGESKPTHIFWSIFPHATNFTDLNHWLRRTREKV